MTMLEAGMRGQKLGKLATKVGMKFKKKNKRNDHDEDDMKMKKHKTMCKKHKVKNCAKCG